MAFVFASVFFCIQQIEHTNMFFSLLYFAFLILSVIAFNFAEGFTRLTGAYIFWYSTLIVIVGVTWKAVVGEPADSNLYSPLLDMSLYTASIVMLLLVTLLNRKIDLRSMGYRGWIQQRRIELFGRRAWLPGRMACHYLCRFLFGQAPGSLVSALVQVNVFGPLGLILVTIGAVKDSGGRRSTSMVSIMAFAYFAYLGVVSFSKQAMLTPMVCWLVGAFYSRLKLRFVHVRGLTSWPSRRSASSRPFRIARSGGKFRLSSAHRAGWNLLIHYSVLHAHVKQLEAAEVGRGEQLL